ncbi:zinc finger protein Elbow [Topomyia yanbarensis]|uniref:zinc finger protein Elbow n=1 Tax=Topomyia yanbarensis TaxID=2498891 RepID=UPI00273C53DF|nr:zinc finger protein Elbow [Topomyia yanbarensis]
MLTSSNQYIRPEYLSPLPNTFDSKTSPLALLAQTCSAIGSDSPNPKLLANIEKSTKNSRDKLSPGTLSNCSSSDTPKSSFKPYESSNHDQTKSPDDGRQMGSRNKSPKQPSTFHQQPANGRCESNQSATSSRASPSSNNRKTPGYLQSNEERVNSPNCASSKDSPTNNEERLIGSTDPVTSKATSEAPSRYFNSSSSESIAKMTTSAPSLVSVGPSYYSAYGSYPMDLMTASALMTPHHQMMKAAAMNPYFNYAKMKASESMMPVCRDPYCTGCALSSHMLGKLGTSSCPAGCTQCDHAGSKNYSPVAAAASLAASQSSAAMYAHAQLAALAAASQLPYVCNWIGSDSSYCGKRFAASEELFQHLRTQHAAAASMSEALLNPATAAAAAAGLPPTHPLFQRSYSTPPLSPLSTARYHPYGKPFSLSPASLAGLPMPPHPSLAQYFHPYSFYGARLNGSNNMHP